MYENGGTLSLVAVPPSYIRMRQEQPEPGQGPFGNHIRTRQGYTEGNHIRTNPMEPMGNIMGSQIITNHIRRDRRNNMLNSMMRGEEDIKGVYV
jgi:hypothetical protein